MKKIFIDMDGVLAKYKEGCEVAEMQKKGYFRTLEPERNMLGALSLLLENCDALGIAVCVLTKVYPSEFKYSLREKMEWRDEYMPELFDSEFVMVNGEEYEKSRAISMMLGAGLKPDCFLIDDYNHNLAEWSQAGGTPIKFVNEINDKNRTFIGNRIDYRMSPEEIYNAILEITGVIKPAPVNAAA